MIIHYGRAIQRAKNEADRLSRLPGNIQVDKMARGLADVLNSSERIQKSYIKKRSDKIAKLTWQHARGSQL